jgi:hypothetical protein
MLDSGSEYWRGPQVEGGGTELQRSYRGLIDLETGELAAPTGDAWRISPAAAQQSLDPTLVEMEEAMTLQRPLPENRLTIVAKDARLDAAV